jgi:hypothetical protein
MARFLFMQNTRRNCNHVLTNGEICQAISLRDSVFCYWHHKARARQRRRDRIAGPLSASVNTGIELPLLEDANAIQIAVQEIMHAILDSRIDSKRAGLLLYSLQLASGNLGRLHTEPFGDGEQIVNIGDDDEEINDAISADPRAEFCDEDCHQCAETDCEERKPLRPEPRPQPKPAAPKVLPPKPLPKPPAPPKRLPQPAADAPAAPAAAG